MTNDSMSPAAQAVLDAVHGQDAEPYPLIVAAALRAAALIANIDRLRLLAIADELEANA